MTEKRNYLRAAALETLWGVSPRHTYNLIAELESLGFISETDTYGKRMFAPEVAQAVLELRKAGKPLSELLLRSDLEAFRQKPMDALDLLISNRAELAILRESLGMIWQSMMGTSTMPIIDWRAAGLPTARETL